MSTNVLFWEVLYIDLKSLLSLFLRVAHHLPTVSLQNIKNVESSTLCPFHPCSPVSRVETQAPAAVLSYSSVLGL